MKKTIFKKMVFLLVTSTLIFGCAEGFLEETNPVELSKDSFWKNVADLDSGLNSVYNALKDWDVLSLESELNRSDMTFPGWGRPNTTNEYWLKTFNSASDTPNGKWQALYKGIFRANQVLEGAESVYPTLVTDLDIEQADLIIAQARTLRGLYYFYLHSGFNNGAVPLIDFVPKTQEEYYQPISPASTIQDFYRADLEYGVDNLPMIYENGVLGKITSGAAMALLGKSYLYEKNYAMAANYFKTIIDDFPYALTSDIGSNFTTRDEYNQESILEIGYSLDFKPEQDPFGEATNTNHYGLLFSSPQVGGWRSVYPAIWLNVEYRNDPIDTVDPRNWVDRPVFLANGLPQLDDNGEVVMETGVLRKFSLRTSASIALPDDVDTPYYLGSSAQGGQYNNSEHSYWRKMTNWEITDHERSLSAAVPKSGVNIRLIRLADIYLMYAESVIAGGTNDAGVDEALMYINKVRRRSGVVLLGLSGTGEYPINDHDDVQYNATTLMDHLMYVERPLELSAEGNAIRTIDLRRWGITKDRFQELSEKQYWSADFPFADKDGKPDTRWASIVLTEDTGDDPKSQWTEFEEAAANYSENLHGFWPIPNSEETSNPKLYDSP